MDTDTQIRTWLAKQLKRDVPDSLWADLVEDRYVSEVRQGYLEHKELLARARHKINRAREIAADFGGGSFSSRGDVEETSASLGEPQPNKVSLNERERERAQAFAEYLAKAAEGEPSVQNFRRRILGVGALSRDQAQDLISSPALSFLSPGWFLTHQMPILGNRIRVLSEERRPWLEFPDHTDLLVHLELPDGRTEVEDILIMSNQQPDTLVLPYTAELSRRKFPVWPGSVLGILRNLSIALSDHYAWRQDAAAWFVLTGEPPIASPLSWSTRRYGEHDFEHWVITLNVAPWVSAETVANFYRYLQRIRLRRSNRPIAERNTALFRFILRHLQPDPDKVNATYGRIGIPTSMISRGRVSVLSSPPWRMLLKLWNEEHPEWKYEDVRLFSRDFYRTHKAISRPYPH